MELGFEVTLFLPKEPERFIPLASCVRYVTPPISSGQVSPISIFRQVIWLTREIRKSPQNVVMAFSLRACVVLALAMPFVRCDRAIFSITGLGLMSLLSDARTRLSRRIVYGILARVARNPKACFVLENGSDGERIGLPTTAQKHQIMGAGVDASEFTIQPMPPRPPLRLVVAGRLIWSKGVDIAVEAVSRLVREGASVELDIYGSPDPDNPRYIPLEVVKDWSQRQGIAYRGHASDMPRVWAEHHVALFPTRGGEGLPRALLEAAASGRPCIVSQVPGCTDFIRDGIEGFVVPANSVDALASAIIRFSFHPEQLEILGRAARARLLETSTTELIKEKYRELFAKVQTCS